MVSNLALFCLVTYLATFQKNWAIFFKSSGHPDGEQDFGVNIHLPGTCTIKFFYRSFLSGRFRTRDLRIILLPGHKHVP
jgi:hypothetical protein